jgi:hypothetical protein
MVNRAKNTSFSQLPSLSHIHTQMYHNKLFYQTHFFLKKTASASVESKQKNSTNKQSYAKHDLILSFTQERNKKRAWVASFTQKQ